MTNVQVWLVQALASFNAVTPVMRSRWGWPASETLHFLGLTLLVGTIGLLDLRILGLARRVPIAALHRLVPWGVLGFIVTASTGVLFLVTEPREYIYNPAFHLKMLFLGLAGLNVAVFYITAFRKAEALGPGDDAPRTAKAIAFVSLMLWLGIIVCGRLLTFYRPGWCGAEGPGFLATCIP
jgi:hypothetical protein